MIIATRRWTLLAWTALGIGILLGAKWAYEEVGWGGYYAWDPVENASSSVTPSSCRGSRPATIT